MMAFIASNNIPSRLFLSRNNTIRSVMDELFGGKNFSAVASDQFCDKSLLFHDFLPFESVFYPNKAKKGAA